MYGNNIDKIFNFLYQAGDVGNKIWIIATKWNYEGRDEKNTIYEFENESEAYTELILVKESGTLNGWRREQRDACHQNNDGYHDEKYCNVDGREIVFDGKSIAEGNPKIDINSLTAGTFNICDPGEKPSSENGKNNILGWIEFIGKGIGHGICDLIPWYILGSSRSEEVSFTATVERIKLSTSKSEQNH